MTNIRHVYIPVAVAVIALSVSCGFYYWSKSSCISAGGTWNSGVVAGNFSYWCEAHRE